MKNILLSLSILIISISSSFSQSDWTNKSRSLPDKLKSADVGILIWHTPNPCYPEKIGDTYYWKHQTIAMALVPDLTVIECGSFIWYDASGWHANIKYSPQEFADKFNCANALLKFNQKYTYQKNWRVGKQIYGGDALWYILARDKNGKIYKGLSLIETEDKLLSN